MGKLKILANVHGHYNYMDASLSQGLQNLGHDVLSYTPGTNYVEHTASRNDRFDLMVDFVKGQQGIGAAKKRVFVWGEDDYNGLERQFKLEYDAVFVRDHLPGQPGFPMNFGIESRYYCTTGSGYKPLQDREIDVCFLGSLWNNRAEYIKRLKRDFGQTYRLELGPRKFNTNDDIWSKWTKSWCAHDPRYFETLANSKICLSFKGAGPDCSRHYESMASGAVCLIENMHTQMVSDADVYWFDGYSDLAATIELVLQGIKDDPEAAQEVADYAWKENRSLHSTTARASYLLDKCGFSQ